jgi:alpha-1,6-mannosyltransferase
VQGTQTRHFDRIQGILMKRTVALFGSYHECLKAHAPGGIATIALATLAAGLSGIYFWVAQQSDDLDSHMPEFIGLLLLAGILYVVAVFLVERFRLGRAAMIVILASTVLFRLVLLPATPSLSDDVYRYQWDGRVQRAHINPYVAIPSSPELARLLNPDNPEPPGIDTPTIYPPLSEFAYRMIETVPGYKRVSTILDLACVGMLLLLLAVMKRPLQRVLAYAWNPAVLISFAMSGHFDPLAIVMFLAALFFLATDRRELSIIALALSFLSKFFPVLLLPAFLKRVRLAYASIFIMLVFTFYLPFLGAGLHLFDGARNYGRDWSNNASFFELLQFVTRSRARAELFAGLIVLAAIGYLAKRRAGLLWSSLVLMGGVLLVSPTAYPWYFTWSIPFLCFYPSGAWLLMSVTSVLGYAPPIADGTGNSPLMLALEYGPVYLWLAYYCWTARGKKRSADVPEIGTPAFGRQTLGSRVSL